MAQPVTFSSLLERYEHASYKTLTAEIDLQTRTLVNTMLDQGVNDSLIIKTVMAAYCIGFDRSGELTEMQSQLFADTFAVIFREILEDMRGIPELVAQPLSEVMWRLAGIVPAAGMEAARAFAHLSAAVSWAESGMRPENAERMQTLFGAALQEA